MLKTKRAYEKAEDSDGKRILVDRLWPRGITKAEADIDQWLKELGPTTELRQWYSHDLEKWPEFKRKYLLELSAAGNGQLLRQIAETARVGTVTLVYGSRDAEHSNVTVLEELIRKMMKKGDTGSVRKAAGRSKSDVAI